MSSSYNIGALRRGAGLTQKELAGKLGVHPNTLAQWERGARQPKSDRVDAISKICLVASGNGGDGGLGGEGTPSIVSRDDMYNKIREALPRYGGGRDLFELCCIDVLRDEWPNLCPVFGGRDGGFDGAAHIDGHSDPIPLVVTTSKQPKRNLNSSLATAKRLYPNMRKAIFATSKSISGPMWRNLREAASNVGVNLRIYDMEALAQRLYHNSRWRKDLLGITGDTSALCPFPVSPRLFPGRLIGRAADIDWITEHRGDCVIAGVPGSGKTTLFREMARMGQTVFMVGEDRGALADAIRDRQDLLRVVVDDAHVRPNCLESLVQVREEVGAHFDIVATCWPITSDIDGINHKLGRTRPGADRTLRRLTDAEIVDVVKDAGVHGTETLLTSILQQADGRPGLAVALARALIHAINEDRLRLGVRNTFSGDSMFRYLGAALERRLGQSVKQLLALFAVGGEGGMPVRDIADYRRCSPIGLRADLACLHEGVVRPVTDGVMAVDPPQLRWQLVRHMFLGSVPDENELRGLIQMAPREQEAIRTLIGAYACDEQRAFPFPVLRDCMERHESDIGLWAQFAGAKREAARLAMEKHPGQMDKLAEPALGVAPNEALPRIFEWANGRPIPPAAAQRSDADDVFARVRRWTSAQRGAREEWVRRRGVLMDEAEKWGREDVGHQRTATAFMCVALLPSVDGEEWAVVGDGITFWSHVLPARDLPVIGGWWGRLRDSIAKVLAENAGDCPWDMILFLVAHWTPNGIGPSRTEEQADAMQATAESMLKDLAPLTKGRPAWRATLLERAARSGIAIDVPPGDEDFDTLYPAHISLSAPLGDLTAHMKRVRALGLKWAKRGIGEVVDMLERTESEAVGAYAMRPNHIRAFCSTVASDGAWDNGRMVALLVERGLSANVVDAFLEMAVKQRQKGWLDATVKCLGDRRYVALAVHTVLTMPQILENVLDKAMSLGVADPSMIEMACFRGLVDMETLRALLKREEPALAIPAAIGHWLADPKGGVDESLIKEWRNVVLSSALYTEFPTREMKSVVGEILEDDPVLAEAWLEKRLSTRSSLWMEEAEESAARGLSSQQRIRLIRCLGRAPQAPEYLRRHAQSCVAALVGNDIEAFKALLEEPALRSYRLDPLMRCDEPNGVWREFASAALAVGESARKIALSSFNDGGTGWIDTGNGLFDRKREIFQSLSGDSNKDVAEVASQGLDAYPTSKK